VKIRETVKQHKAGILFSVLLIVSLLCLSFSTHTLVIYPKKIGHSVIGFFQEGINAVGSFFGGTVESIRGYKELKAEYAELEKRLTEYRANMDRSVELKYENDRLREFLNFRENIDYKTIPAKVIAKDPENIFPTIVINKGSINGVEQNMPVLGIQNGVEGLVGKVLEVSLKTSKIMPLSDTNCFVAARLQSSRYEGLVNGKGSHKETIQMLYITEHARNTMQTGDTVITSGMNSLYPPGIKIGFVESIYSKSYETSLKLDLKPVINFSKLEYITVVANLMGDDE